MRDSFWGWPSLASRLSMVVALSLCVWSSIALAKRPIKDGAFALTLDSAGGRVCEEYPGPPDERCQAEGDRMVERRVNDRRPGEEELLGAWRVYFDGFSSLVDLTRTPPIGDMATDVQLDAIAASLRAAVERSGQMTEVDVQRPTVERVGDVQILRLTIHGTMVGARVASVGAMILSRDYCYTLTARGRSEMEPALAAIVNKSLATVKAPAAQSTPYSKGAALGRFLVRSLAAGSLGCATVFSVIAIARALRRRRKGITAESLWPGRER
jgi:hypothetical protein